MNLQKLIDQIKPLAKRFPVLYPAWQATFINAYVCGEISPKRSYSLSGRQDVENFAAFIKPTIAHKFVIDIGGGPTAAAYLIRPNGATHIIDPLLGTGVAEDIRTDATQYDVCIFATSLDHLCHVHAGLLEASRVLKRSGKIIVWSNKEAPPRNPCVEVDGVWYYAPPGASDPFHYRQLGMYDVQKEMSNVGFYLTRHQCEEPDQCFQEYSRC